MQIGKNHPRGTLDKDILKIDERLNILYMVYSGQLLKIFPKPSDTNNGWVDPAQAVMTLDHNLSVSIKSNLSGFYGCVGIGFKSGKSLLCYTKNRVD